MLNNGKTRTGIFGMAADANFSTIRSKGWPSGLPTASRMLVQAIIVVALSLPTAAWATLVTMDGFTDGSTVVNSSGHDVGSNEAASVPGGQRAIWLSGDSNYGTDVSATVDTTNNQLIVGGTFSSITLGYGAKANSYPMSSIGSDPQHAINQDWSGYSGIRIPFLEATSWMSVHASGYSNNFNNLFSGPHTKISQDGSLDILFGDWLRTNVDEFTIAIDIFRGDEYKLGPLQFIASTPESVPEPGVLSLFLLALVLLVAGRVISTKSGRSGA